jgi:energy-coupling factor transporter ATP-binding protein EcfA2
MVLFKVKRWNLKTVKENRIFAFFGKRGAGKSTFMRWLTYVLDNRDVAETGKKRWDFGCAASPTRESQAFFKSIFGECLVRTKFDKTLIDTAIQVSRALDKRQKKRNWLVAVDDCGYDKDALKGEVMRDLFMNGRQYNADVFYAFQYCMDLDRSMRSQIDYVFCFREPSHPNRERLWTNFGGVFKTIGEFSKTMEACTQNNEVMVIDVTSKSSNPADVIFWTKASLDVPEYKVGRPIFHYLSQLAFIKDDKDDILSKHTRNTQPDINDQATGGCAGGAGGVAAAAVSKASKITKVTGGKRKRGGGDDDEESITMIEKQTEEEEMLDDKLKRQRVNGPS